MKRLAWFAALALVPLSASAEETAYPPTPAEIVKSAPPADWLAIDPADLLVMELAPDREGNPREVVIQLMPPPFSQGWVSNIRKLAKAHWWDGTSVYRVQDNYVAQWGDVSEEKKLPEGLRLVPESDYTVPGDALPLSAMTANSGGGADSYATFAGFDEGWAIAGNDGAMWPTHCYAMVGVARDPSPDTGTGSELYTVIGHAPRQLDRNIALVGRVIAGIENLSALPRGKGELGFYADDEADKRVPILSVRLGSELSDPPNFEYLSTGSDSFAAYAHARANRQDEFYQVPAGGADICNIPVPVRPVKPAK